MFGVRFVTYSAVFTRIASASLTVGNAQTVGGIQLIDRRCDDQTTDTADKTSGESDQFVDGTNFWNTADIERFDKIQSVEATLHRSMKCAVIFNGHDAVFLVADKFHRVPFAHVQRFVRLDDDRPRANVETELGECVIETKGDKIATTTRPLSVVEDEAIGRFRFKGDFNVEFRVGVGQCW